MAFLCCSVEQYCFVVVAYIHREWMLLVSSTVLLTLFMLSLSWFYLRSRKRTDYEACASKTEISMHATSKCTAQRFVYYLSFVSLSFPEAFGCGTLSGDAKGVYIYTRHNWFEKLLLRSELRERKLERMLVLRSSALSENRFYLCVNKFVYGSTRSVCFTNAEPQCMSNDGKHRHTESNRLLSLAYIHQIRFSNLI